MPVRVQVCDFDVGAEINLLRAGNPKIGAIVTFLGTMRDFSEGQNVSEMELEHYPGMTEKALEDIVCKAKGRWPITEALVIHRIGALKPLEHIVLVAVTSSHRECAFLACEFIIDYLKTHAPFWKKEHTQQGVRWVDARAVDDLAIKKWEGQ